LSVFKPVTFESGLPPQGPRPTDRPDGESRWWRGEAGRRAALGNYPAAIAAFAPQRDALERAFRERVDEVLARDRGPEAMGAMVRDCWREADAMEADWARALPTPTPTRDLEYHRSWARP
jgi:hypothetical protein